MNVKKLYESKDASLNVSFQLDLLRWLAGMCYTAAPFNREIRMVMVALHLGPLCFTFTSFRMVEPPPALRSKPVMRSATKQSGKYKPR